MKKLKAIAWSIYHNKDVPYLMYLLIVFFVIVGANMPFGTSLLGWDNILPELDFSGNWRHGFFSMWQPNQGLGSTTGHPYATTLLHTTFLSFLSLFIPNESLRPIFHLLMLLVGALGAYILISRQFTHRIYALLGAILFMINFGTVQMFYIPLEPFSVHFAFLPWILFLLMKLFSRWSTHEAMIFALVLILSSFQAFIPPLFVTLVMIISLAGLIYAFSQPSRDILKRIGGVLVIVFVTSAFWLLPLTYYTLQDAGVYLNSYNNRMSTPEFIMRSAEYGNIESLLYLKGFIYDSLNTVPSGQIKPIFDPWHTHFSSPFVSFSIRVLAILALVGLVVSIISKKEAFWTIAAIFLLAFTFLAVDTFPFSAVSRTLQEHIPIFRQAFRIPFTKLIITFSLTYSVLIAIATSWVTQFLRGRLKNQIPTYITPAALASIALIAFFPVFTGNMLYDKTRINLPYEYEQVFSFFASVPSHEKIANLPQPVPTGWSNYRWGYGGSGFWWYGLRQPILDRNFDVWNDRNEQYYWELSQALYSEDPDMLRNVFDKYMITWVMVDENIISYTHYRALLIERIQELLRDTPGVVEEKRFEQIRIYHISRSSPSQDVVKVLHNPPQVLTGRWTAHDPVFERLGSYVSPADVQSASVIPALPHLFTGRGESQPALNAQYSDAEIHLTSSLPEDPHAQEFELFGDANSLSSILLYGGEQPQISVTIPEALPVYSSEAQKTGNEWLGSQESCSPLDTASRASQTIRTDLTTSFVQFASKDTRTCRVIRLPTLSHRSGYLIRVISRHHEGAPLSLWIESLTNHHAVHQVYLHEQNEFTEQSFVIPPQEAYGLGYVIHLDNIAFGRRESINDLSILEVYKIPYDELHSLAFRKNPDSVPATHSAVLALRNPTPTRYEVATNPTDNTVLALYQTYHPGWKAYIVDCQSPNFQCQISKTFPNFFGKELTSHVRVNNWANGWYLETDSSPQRSNTSTFKLTNPTTRPLTHTKTHIIIFLPQILQYMGMIVTLFTVPIIIITTKSILNR